MGELVDPRILYRISDFFSEYLRTSQEKLGKVIRGGEKEVGMY